ncbi:unnamed protein product, partial [Prorocentrum cordatum]
MRTFMGFCQSAVIEKLDTSVATIRSHIAGHVTILNSTQQDMVSQQGQISTWNEQIVDLACQVENMMQGSVFGNATTISGSILAEPGRQLACAAGKTYHLTLGIACGPFLQELKRSPK